MDNKMNYSSINFALFSEFIYLQTKTLIFTKTNEHYEQTKTNPKCSFPEH